MVYGGHSKFNYLIVSILNNLTFAVYMSLIFLFQFLLDLCDDQLDVIMGLSISTYYWLSCDWHTFYGY